MVETEHHQRVCVTQDSFIYWQLVPRLINSLEHCHRMASDFTSSFLKCERGTVEQFQGPGNPLHEMHAVPFRSLIGRPGNSAHFSHCREAVVKLCDIPVGLPWVTPGPEDGIALVPQLMKIRIIRPYIHRKLKLADKACATDERGDSSLDSVFGRALRQRRTVRPSAPDHLPPVHIHCGVPRVHATNVRTKRAGIPVRIHVRVSEGIVALKIGAETWIIFIWREDKRSPAPPPSHQLGRYPFLLLRCFAMFPEKIAKCAHMLFHPQIRDIAAVTRKNPRLRHSRGRTFFIRIPEKKFTWFDRRARAGCRLDSRSLDNRLREPVAVSEVFVSVVERRKGFQIQGGEKFDSLALH